MKRNHDIHIIVSKEEKEILKDRSKSVGLTLNGYIRFVLLNTKPKIQVT